MADSDGHAGGGGDLGGFMKARLEQEQEQAQAPP